MLKNIVAWVVAGIDVGTSKHYWRAVLSSAQEDTHSTSVSANGIFEGWISHRYVRSAFLKLTLNPVRTLLPIAKRCEVCGGTVNPVDDQSPFGYCEACGIVYALKERLRGSRGYDTPTLVEEQTDEGPRGTDTSIRETPANADEPTKQSGSHWKCPDCGTDLGAENDSDLEFVKREHVREYHPNRAN